MTSHSDLKNTAIAKHLEALETNHSFRFSGAQLIKLKETSNEVTKTGVDTPGAASTTSASDSFQTMDSYPESVDDILDRMNLDDTKIYLYELQSNKTNMENAQEFMRVANKLIEFIKTNKSEQQPFNRLQLFILQDFNGLLCRLKDVKIPITECLENILNDDSISHKIREKIYFVLKSRLSQFVQDEYQLFEKTHGLILKNIVNENKQTTGESVELNAVQALTELYVDYINVINDKHSWLKKTADRMKRDWNEMSDDESDYNDIIDSNTNFAKPRHKNVSEYADNISSVASSRASELEIKIMSNEKNKSVVICEVEDLKQSGFMDSYKNWMILVFCLLFILLSMFCALKYYKHL